MGATEHGLDLDEESLRTVLLLYHQRACPSTSHFRCQHVPLAVQNQQCNEILKSSLRKRTTCYKNVSFVSVEFFSYFCAIFSVLFRLLCDSYRVLFLPKQKQDEMDLYTQTMKQMYFSVLLLSSSNNEGSTLLKIQISLIQFNVDFFTL